MVKKYIIGVLILFCIVLTGCSSEKQCTKWVTKSNGTIQDCSKMSGYEKTYCELKNQEVSSTQECVKWDR